MAFDREAAKKAGYTDSEIDEYLAGQESGLLPAQSRAEPPAAQSSLMGRLGRQAGLTARAGVEGLLSVPGMAADALGKGISLLPGVNIPSTSETISRGLTQLGVPQPETSIERIAGAGARTLAGTGGILGAAKGLPEMIKGAVMAAPGGQAASSIGAGVAGQTAAEMGASPMWQMAAGLAGSMAPSAGYRAAVAIPKKVADVKQVKLFQAGAPTSEALKDRARAIYTEIDDMGAVVGQQKVDDLARSIGRTVKEAGFHPRIHKKASAVLDELETIKGQPQKLTDIETFRRIAQEAAKSIEPADARLGAKIIGKIDEFMDGIDQKSLIGGAGKDIGPKYREARNVWQRVRKSELLEEAIQKADLQATGFENGLRIQFRSLLNNKKKMRGFTPEEKAAMETVVKGTTAANITKALGKFGIGEDQAVRMLIPGLGVASGAAVAGPVGAVAVPLIGQVSRNLAQKLTANNARLANDIVRAGSNGRDITKAYMKSVPANQRNAQELTELLMKPGVNIKSLAESAPKMNDKVISNAVFYADFLRSQQELEEK